MLGYYYLFYYFGFGYLIFNNAFIYYILAVSIILSIFIGLSLTFTIYSISKRIKVTKSVIGSIISSILPSTLCCSSILPTIIFSIAGSYTAITLGGKIEAIFSLYNLVFSMISIFLSITSFILASKNIATCDLCKFEVKRK